MKYLYTAVLLLLTCVISQESLAQCCTYRLNMHDSYGDGWDGATLEIIHNNVSLGLFSAANSGTNDTLVVCTGDSLQLIYTPGDYENENSYQLIDGSWNTVYAAGPDPAAAP